MHRFQSGHHGVGEFLVEKLCFFLLVFGQIEFGIHREPAFPALWYALIMTAPKDKDGCTGNRNKKCALKDV
ncbi:hypothetical protein [Flavonifractor sp. AGMB03687]|uniref:hypothetical protein n=1 Tax=Flavonifractor sp. AGMB03687 TaxID=2785133 RepID=UPI001AE0E321|nr:hypothetical protein [Flavonifractor sp. AGMB03687]